MKSKIIFALAFFIALSCSDKSRQEPKATYSNRFLPLNDFIDVLQDGDVVLKLGYGAVSKLITKQLKEEIPLSHCGVVYRKNDTIYIVHSVSGSIAEEDGVQTINIQHFHSDTKPESLFILRCKDSLSRSKISLEAKRVLKQNIPFDHEFDLSENEKLYCSEFVHSVLYTALGKNYFDVKPIGNNKVYTFNNILKSEDFILVNKKN